jgi:hypothetical protein
MSKPKRPALSEAGRVLAAARSVVGPIHCEVCGKEVIATTAGRYKRQYCSRACQARAYRQAHQDEINAYRRERYRCQRAQQPRAGRGTAGGAEYGSR